MQGLEYEGWVGPTRPATLFTGPTRSRFRRLPFVRRTLRTPARVGALLHLRVVPELSARFFACAAALGADFAHARVALARAGEEARARLADVNAIEERLDVLRVRVIISHVEAVRDGLEADLRAVRARVDAGAHRRVDGRSVGLVGTCVGCEVWWSQDERPSMQCPCASTGRVFEPRLTGARRLIGRGGSGSEYQ